MTHMEKRAVKLIANYKSKCKSLDHDTAKQCSLIAVDEIMRSIKMLHEVFGTPIYATLKYWRTVKKEIEKL